MGEQAQTVAEETKHRTVLLVDDADDVRLTTKWFLCSFGFAVDSARNAEEALALFNANVHDVIVTDNRMAGMTGLEMAHVIKMRSPLTPVIMFAREAPRDKSCLDGVIQRPAHLLRLIESLDRVLLGR